MFTRQDPIVSGRGSSLTFFLSSPVCPVWPSVSSPLTCLPNGSRCPVYVLGTLTPGTRQLPGFFPLCLLASLGRTWLYRLSGKGPTVGGGKVSGPHLRKAEWVELEAWSLPQPPGLLAGSIAAFFLVSAVAFQIAIPIPQDPGLTEKPKEKRRNTCRQMKTYRRLSL